MRTPKAPAGFVPVDSEEAKGIANHVIVFVVRILDGRWIADSFTMGNVREWAPMQPSYYYHVQLPPPVEWEEVWGIRPMAYSNTSEPLWSLTKNGEYVLQPAPFSYDELNTIVRALNEMENQC